MSDELVLYTNPMSRGRIARWMLEEVGATYRTVLLDYGPAMKAPDYLALNPMGKVPVLQQGRTVVTETAAICAWLAEVFPAAGLAPPPTERAAYYRWLFFGAGPLEAAVSARTLGFEPKTPQERGRVGFGTLELVALTLEQALRATPYLAGERFTAADVYVGAQIGWGLQFGFLEPRPAFTDYVARLTGRAAYQRAKALDDAATTGAAPA